jgi:predicted AlkP superfamily phosphohydrolase/phosphomutase
MFSEIIGLKILVIGMDGVGIDTFIRGWTPYLASLIDSGTMVKLKEDLLSRGWLEIVTGQHAIKTGALYEGPVADGTLTWTDSFKLEDIPNLGIQVKPIWQVLNERGYKVGIMNIPTTYPAPKVDGFFISGGGGGGSISQEIAEEQCQPDGLMHILHGLRVYRG